MKEEKMDGKHHGEHHMGKRGHEGKKHHGMGKKEAGFGAKLGHKGKMNMEGPAGKY